MLYAITMDKSHAVAPVIDLALNWSQPRAIFVVVDGLSRRVMRLLLAIPWGAAAERVPVALS